MRPRKVGVHFIILFVIVSATSMAVVHAQAKGNLPTAAQVLERYVEVTGGREALLRRKSMTIHGRYQVPAKKLDLETVTYMKNDKAVWKFIFPGGKEFVSGFDGKVGWDMTATGKVTLLKGNALESRARDADMYYHLHVMDYFRSMDVTGMKEYDGKLCYHLRGVNKWGQVNEHFYDMETGLLVGYAFNTTWRGGKGVDTVTFEDYKNFGGVLMPTRTTSREGKDLSISLTSSVTYDDVDDSVFVPPEAVKKAAETATCGGTSWWSGSVALKSSRFRTHFDSELILINKPDLRQCSIRPLASSLLQLHDRPQCQAT